MPEQGPRRAVNPSTVAQFAPQPGDRHTSPASVPTLHAGLFASTTALIPILRYSVFEKTLKVRAMLDWVAMRITPAAGGLLNLSSALGPYDLLTVENDISPILTPPVRATNCFLERIE